MNPFSAIQSTARSEADGKMVVANEPVVFEVVRPGDTLITEKPAAAELR